MARQGVIWFVANISLLFAVQSYAADGLSIAIELAEAKITSETVPFKLVLTNGSDKTISVLKPIVGSNMVVCVYDQMGVRLARSAIPSDYNSVQEMSDNKKYVSMDPRTCLESDAYELFSVVYPVFRISRGQTVLVNVVYLLNGKEYKANAQIHIPQHDFELKHEFISKERASELAFQELKTRGYRMETIDGIEPEVRCINGIYRISYLPNGAKQATMRGGGGLNIKIDAATGKVLQVSMGRR